MASQSLKNLCPRPKEIARVSVEQGQYTSMTKNLEASTNNADNTSSKSMRSDKENQNYWCRSSEKGRMNSSKPKIAKNKSMKASFCSLKPIEEKNI